MQQHWTQQDLKRFNRVLRHRLRNHASGMKNAIRMLASELDEQLEPSQKEYFPLLLKECEALQNLTERLNLLFDDLAPGPPATLLQLAVQVHTEAAERFPTTLFEFHPPESRSDPMVQESGLVRIPLREIMINAAEAAGGTVALQCIVRDDMAILRVTDHGPGIPPESEAEALTPFSMHRARHLGVGLAVASRWLQSLNGELSFTRDGDQEFTTTIALPLENGCIAARRQTSAESNPAPNTEPLAEYNESTEQNDPMGAA